MASITGRGGKFLARVRLDGFKGISKTFHKKADAVAWARSVEADMQGGRWVDGGSTTPTVREALAHYRKSAVLALKGAATYSYWLDELALAPFAGKPVDKLTPFDLATWRDSQAGAGLSAGTVARKLGLVSGFLSWCHKERGWITSNPMRSVRKPRANDERDRTLNDDERRHLLAAAAGGRCAWLPDVLAVLLHSAMRRSELWGLKSSDVDFERCTARLADTKNGSARQVPLCPVSLAALRRLANAAASRGDTALVPVEDPHSVSLAFRRALNRARATYVKTCAAAGVDADAGFLADVRLHDLRHCAVTAWASTGALSLPELMAVSGHKTPRMLTRYVNLSAVSVAEKLAQLSA